MAVIVIPNQPLKLIENGETFNERNARQMWDRRQFCQLVKTSQVQQFQLKVTEDTGTNLIANGDFTANINGWSVIPAGSVQVNPSVSHAPQGRAIFVPINATTIGRLEQTLILTDKTYKLTFDVLWNPLPGETQGVSYGINNAFQIGGDSPVLQSVTSGLQTYTSYWRLSSISNNFIGFAFASNINTGGTHDFAQSIDNVVLVELTEPVLSLQDCDGNYIKDINVVERFEDIITYTHSWAGLTDGQCYRFCLLGGDDLSLNYLEGSFCLLDERNQPILDEEGNCLSQEIS